MNKSPLQRKASQIDPVKYKETKDYWEGYDSGILPPPEETAREIELTAELEEKEALILNLTDKIGVLQVAVSQNEVNNQVLEEHVKKLQAQVSTSTGTITEMKAYITGLRQENESLNDKIGNCLNQLKKLELEVSNGESKVHEMDVELTKISKQKNVLCTKLGEKDVQISNHIEQIAELEESIKDTVSKNQQLEGKVKRLDGKMDKAETTIEDLEGQVKALNADKGSLNKTLEEKEARIMEQVDKTEDLKEAVALNESCNRQLEEKIRCLEQEVAKGEQTISKMDRQVGELSTMKDSLSFKIDRMEDGIKNAEKENLEIRCEKVKIEREKTSLEESLDGAKSECRLLESQLSNHCILHSSPRRCHEKSIEEIGLGLKVEKLTSENEILNKSIERSQERTRDLEETCRSLRNDNMELDIERMKLRNSVNKSKTRSDSRSRFSSRSPSPRRHLVTSESEDVCGICNSKHSYLTSPICSICNYRHTTCPRSPCSKYARLLTDANNRSF